MFLYYKKKKKKHKPLKRLLELWCWGRLLRVLWTARKSKQSIPKKINPEYSVGKTDGEAEAPML